MLAARSCKPSVGAIPQGSLRLSRRKACCVRAASAPRFDVEPYVQLATAKIPANVDGAAFNKAMYNWASTLVQSGANYPFVTSLLCDRIPTGLKISLMANITPKELASAGEIEATLEPVPEQGQVLFVRFYEGPASTQARNERAPKDPKERLEAVIASLVDVPTIMQTMPNAIRKAAQVSVVQ
ncbi:hypothetical protein DUNSADRAFT_3090 [Dunaliella salina]|uniref:DUF7148 domain-containing protein n=2 Tax=Dunaliella salina TaxID=3046 RepID=A0ABQ7GUL7_DUNSA|nr:hypothetical protein DUNSADRAFT_3090 [Dunaliella salina]|eukprot:KAF5838294.1 hypothetical protein DUNSADRAFT_3090 [Dunaliella salina]